MENFNNTLRDYIKESGYSITKFAEKCNIDRAWLSNVLSGRKQLSSSKFDNIIESNIFDSNQIDTLKTLYNKKEFTEEEIEKIEYILSRVSRKNRRNECIIPVQIDKEKRMHFGKLKVLSHLYDLLENSDEYSLVYTNIPSASEEAIDILHHFLSLECNKNKDYRHIFFTNDGSDTRNLNTYFTICDFAELGFSNMVVIKNINLTSMETNDFFPYYLLTDKKMILFDSYFNNAIITVDENIVNIYLQKFMKLFDKGEKTVVQFENGIELMRTLSTMHDSTSELSFTPDFCITPLLDYDILSSNAAPNLPNKELLIQAVLNHYNMDYSKFYNFITMESLDRFVKDGTIYEIPRTYLKPINLDGRIKLLKKIKDNIETAKYYKSYIFNPTKLEYNSFDIQMEKIGAVGICGIRQNHKGDDDSFMGEWLCTVSDSNIYSDFLKFKEYVVLTSVVYSDEFSSQYVGNLIKELEVQSEANK